MLTKIFPIWILLTVTSASCHERTGITYAKLEKTVVENYISTSGYVVEEAGNKINIPSPASGIISSILVREDQHIKSGTVMAAIENSEFIVLQQEYMEARNLLDFYREEYTRQGELTVENATSMKKLQVARRDFQSAEIKFNALALQLKILGITPDSIKSDRLLQALPVTAFRSGIVSEIINQPGTFVHKGDPLFIMVSEKRHLAKFVLPEQDYLRVAKGQTVECKSAYDSVSIHKAIISNVIPEIDPVNHTTTVFAELSGNNLKVIPGMSVQAKILTGADTVFIITSGAVMNENNSTYILVMDNGTYRKVPVQIGRSQQGKTEIHGISPEMTDSVVISGFEELRLVIGR